MDFLGIGPLELILVFIIILLVLGPKEMVKTGQTIGEFLRRMFTSDGWKALQNISREARNLPTKLVREAGIEEFQKQAKSIADGLPNKDEFTNTIGTNIDAWTKAPVPESTPPEKSETPHEPPQQES